MNHNTEREMQYIPIGQLHPHPDNPRVIMREDVVDSIAAQLADAGAFDPAHALMVRPVADGYQIIQGHHRRLAAEKAGIETLPCWVREMSDEDAYMQLALGNAQGELSPLEIGIHALKAVEPAGPGRGIEGGIREYARRIGKAQPNVTSYRQAAQVLDSVKNDITLYHFLDKASHLAAIHDADKSLWPLLVNTMIQRGWSVQDTEHWVNLVLQFDIPSKWQGVFLPYEKVIEHFLATLEFSPQTVGQLIKGVEATIAVIDSYDIDREQHTNAFIGWLSNNIGADSWDIRKIAKYRRELEQQLEQAAITIRQSWNQGNWRDAVEHINDSSIALIITDPPYGVGYQSDYRLDRQQPRKHDPIANDNERAAEELEAAMKAFYPKMVDNAHVFVFTSWHTEHNTRQALQAAGFDIRGSLIWVKNNTGMGDVKTTFAPQHERIIHAVKGSPLLWERQSDVLMFDRENSALHPTQKPTALLCRLIEITTVEGEIVADPFGGVASTLVAAKSLNRAFWGCEVETEYYQHGLQRLAA